MDEDLKALIRLWGRLDTAIEQILSLNVYREPDVADEFFVARYEVQHHVVRLIRKTGINPFSQPEPLSNPQDDAADQRRET